MPSEIISRFWPPVLIYNNRGQCPGTFSFTEGGKVFKLVRSDQKLNVHRQFSYARIWGSGFQDEQAKVQMVAEYVTFYANLEYNFVLFLCCTFLHYVNFSN